MLLFIEKTDGTVLHNVGSVFRGAEGGVFIVRIINGFGQKEKDIELLDSEILVLSSYEYVNKHK